MFYCCGIALEKRGTRQQGPFWVLCHRPLKVDYFKLSQGSLFVNFNLQGCHILLKISSQGCHLVSKTKEDKWSAAVKLLQAAPKLSTFFAACCKHAAPFVPFSLSLSFMVALVRTYVRTYVAWAKKIYAPMSKKRNKEGLKTGLK